MDWISTYRLNISYFNQNDKLKEISKFIHNHNYLLDHVAERREAKISYILNNKNYKDPLAFLNSVIDILEDKIERTLDAPQSVINYMENGKMNQKFVRADSLPFSSLKDFEDYLIDKIKQGYKIYPFQVLPDFKNNTIFFRGAIFSY
jgi:hypothetical protein